MACFDCLEMESARDILLRRVNPIAQHETVSLSEAGGRIAFADIHASLDQPPFNRSPIDGYAAHHLDLAEASENNPAILRVTQTIYAGDAPRGYLARGESARVTTGASLPAGATCVAWQEDAKEHGDMVHLHCHQHNGDNITPRGSDIATGHCLVKKGLRFSSGVIGLLSGQGLAEVTVFARPTVGVLATGSELCPAGTPLPAGKIYESNNAMLTEMVRERGAAPLNALSAPDDPSILAAALEKLITECDMVITTGGVSVGPRDYMTEVADSIGAETLFHGIDAKPGSPALALWKNDKPVLCLSGNPFAAFATFELLATPVIRRLAGASEIFSATVECALQNPFPKKSRGRRFVRARMQGGTVFVPEGSHESGALMSLVHCNCLLDIPAGSPALAPGTPVRVIPL